jgi:D-3-phosphoglycerate dehydrogenase
MDKPDILYYSCLHYTPEHLALLDKLYTVHVLPNPRLDSTLPQEIKDKIKCIFLPHGFKFTDHTSYLFPQLIVIASNTTTPPDVDEKANIPHIQYLNDPGVLGCITSTAEHALGLMHTVHRRIPSAAASTYEGCWDRYSWGAPKMLSQMNATIWGMGRVGSHLADITAPLFKGVAWIDKPDVSYKGEYIEECLSQTDVLFLTMSVEGPQPVCSGTYLRLLPQDAIVINVARGEVLDHDTLLELLNNRKLWGAGLDVLPQDHAFSYDEVSSIWERIRAYQADNNNLIVTPHIAGSTKDAWRITQRYIIDRVGEVLL